MSGCGSAHLAGRVWARASLGLRLVLIPIRGFVSSGKGKRKEEAEDQDGEAGPHY